MPRAPITALTAGAIAVMSLACGGGPGPAAPGTEPSPPALPSATVGPADVTPTRTTAATPAPDTEPTAAGGAAGRPAAPEAGLWAGEVQSGPGLPWLAFRIVPGADPDVDPWRIESGPFTAMPPALECTPAPTDGGWRLGPCAGLIEGDLEALVPRDPAAMVRVTLTYPWGAVRARLSRVRALGEPAASDNVEVLWHQSGSGLHSDIWVADGLVFAPRLDGAVEIIDAASGEILGEASVPGSALDVKARDGVLHVASDEEGLWTFDVSDPSAPRRIGHLASPPGEDGREPDLSHHHNIALSPDGRTVYVIDNGALDRADLALVDVSDPAAPALSGVYRLGEGPGGLLGATHDVQVIEAGGRLIAYLNHLTEGLLILDVTDPAAIERLGTARWDDIFSHSGWPFEAGGRLYYAHTSEGYDRHLAVLDVTDPADPAVVSRFATRRGVSIHNVQVAGGIAYVSYYIDGLRVIDLRDPASPRQVAHFDTVPGPSERGLLQGAWGVMALDGVVYISDIESGIYALRVHLD